MTFTCPRCGVPGSVFDGVTTYGCVCRFGAYESPLAKFVHLPDEERHKIYEEVMKWVGAEIDRKIAEHAARAAENGTPRRD
jgi:hypothetical protein